MAWQEFSSVTEAALLVLLGETQNPPPPPSFSDGPPAPPQPAADSSAIVQPGTGSQGQNLLHQSPGNSFPTPALATVPPAAPSNPFYDLPTIPDSMVQQLHPFGELSNVLFYHFDWSAPPLSTYTPKKKKRPDQQHEDQPYIKKPPNAFMLFLKEQRPKVKEEMRSSGSAAVNMVVGERWKSLMKDQQAKYYEQAKEQKMLHNQQHPNWSCKDNYGKKRKRVFGSTCSTE